MNGAAAVAQTLGDYRTTGSAIAPETKLESLTSRVRNLAELVNLRAEQLTNIGDRLFGERPEGEGKPRPMQVYSGQIGDLEAALDVLEARLDRLGFGVDRFGGFA